MLKYCRQFLEWPHADFNEQASQCLCNVDYMQIVT